MIKKTLYFGNPAYLSCSNQQLVIGIPESKGIDKLLNRSIPIEDIGIVILDHRQITITQHLLTSLIENNIALVNCNEKHLPHGLLLHLEGHTLHQARLRAQMEASVPLKKQLWQQTVKAKIINQAFVLNKYGIPTDNMLYWASEVKSGDTENHEGRAAAYYWDNLFAATIPQFRRDPDGQPPNHLLNYGYAILRAMVARGLVASGLFPALGIFHKNQYNAYCLADDVMEPFRPLVDILVCNLLQSQPLTDQITTEQKKELLTIPVLDILMEGKRSPLMVGMQRTTASLVECFEGNTRKIIYPDML
jgi:CRISPR-associated protein Cas1